MTDILMPKATAVWMVDNTSLTFEQIADFCGLHPLEVRGIADGDVARDIRGVDPITGGQLTREELDKAQDNADYRMQAVVSRHAELLKTHKPAPKYTPVSRRQDRPDAIAWFVRNHPEVTDAQIAKLLGTTKSTIESVRNRTHWNSPNIKPVDPVTLGLVGQLVLDDLISKAAAKKNKDDLKKGGGVLQPVEPNRSRKSSSPRPPSAAPPNRPPPRSSAPRTEKPSLVGEDWKSKKGPGIAPGAFPIPFKPTGTPGLSRPGLETGNLLLQSELSSLELPDLQRIRGRVTHLPLDRLIQLTVTISQFADTSFDGHGLRLHV
jgi:hypothetical protein